MTHNILAKKNKEARACETSKFKKAGLQNLSFAFGVYPYGKYTSIAAKQHTGGTRHRAGQVNPVWPV